MQRIFLFLITNIAIMVILSITLRILGVESLLMQNGSDLNINALVIFSGSFWFWWCIHLTSYFKMDG